jgi:Xaa-Pro dipeptidase
MKISRRDLFRSASLASGAALGGGLFGAFTEAQDAPAAHASGQLPPAFDKLQPLGDRVKPISTPEFRGRVAHAQQLMSDAKPRFEALYVTPGTTLLYYTGIYWWPSERVLALLIPRQGEPLMVCPAFEEARLREQLRWPIEIRAWQEDESPIRLRQSGSASVACARGTSA